MVKHLDDYAFSIHYYSVCDPAVSATRLSQLDFGPRCAKATSHISVGSGTPILCISFRCLVQDATSSALLGPHPALLHACNARNIVLLNLSKPYKPDCLKGRGMSATACRASQQKNTTVINASYPRTRRTDLPVQCLEQPFFQSSPIQNFPAAKL